jgi:hypothetical protein
MSSSIVIRAMLGLVRNHDIVQAVCSTTISRQKLRRSLLHVQLISQNPKNLFVKIARPLSVLQMVLLVAPNRNLGSTQFGVQDAMPDTLSTIEIRMQCSIHSLACSVH